MLIQKGTKKRERKKRTKKASLMPQSISSSMPHIVYQQPSYLLHMKPKSFIWDHFVVVKTKPNGAAKTVRCKHDGCPYRKAANLFWKSVHPDSTVAQLGKLLGCIPSSQASVERVFSTASWLATDQERLGFTKPAREVFIRYNFKALSA